MAIPSDPAEHRWPYHWIYFPLGKLIIGGLLRILGRFRVHGRGRIPKAGGLLLVCNHLSDCDAGVVQLACSRPIHFMAKSELFLMKGVGLALKMYGSFPVKRGNADLTALRRAINFLRDGQVVCVFPEGQVSETGKLQELMPGVALIVRKSGATVLCGGIKNSNLLVPYGAYTPRFTREPVEMTWGSSRQFAIDAPAEEIMAWVQSQLRELS